MADWNTTMAALEEAGDELKRDPSEFHELPVAIGALQTFFESNERKHPYPAILHYLILLLERIQTDFSVKNWMETEALLVERALVLRTLGERIASFAAFCRYEAHPEAFLFRLSLLADTYRAATARMNGRAAEEAAVADTGRHLGDANP